MTLNPPGARAALTQPDGIATDVSTVEIYPPTVGSATLTNPAVTSPLLPAGAAATLTNATLTNATLTNATLTNANLANAEVATLTNATLTNATLTNATLTNATLTNATLTNATLTNTSVVSGAISDATYLVTNEGNTTHSYHVKIVGSAPSTPLQLIISRAYATPVEQDCALVLEPHDVVLASIDDVSGAIVPPGGSIADPNIPDPRATNATVALAPGESARITLRGAIDLTGMAQLASQLAPVVVPHAGGAFAAPLLVTTDGAALPGARAGVPYQGALQAMAGRHPTPGRSRPAPARSPAGSRSPPRRDLRHADRHGHVHLHRPGDRRGRRERHPHAPAGGRDRAHHHHPLLSPAAPLAGQPVTLTATVAAATSGAGVPLPGGQVTFFDGETSLGAASLSGGAASITVTTLAAGPHVLLAVYGGSATFAPSTSAPRVVTVAAAYYQFTGFLSPLATAGESVASPSLSSAQRLGGAVPIKWQLRDATGAILTGISTTRLLQAIQNLPPGLRRPAAGGRDAAPPLHAHQRRNRRQHLPLRRQEPAVRLQLGHLERRDRRVLGESC